jgi:hypothetical protein
MGSTKMKCLCGAGVGLTPTLLDTVLVNSRDGKVA